MKKMFPHVQISLSAIMKVLMKWLVCYTDREWVNWLSQSGEWTEMRGMASVLIDLFSQLQSDLDQEYQDKFRRLPVEIQEFVQETSKRKLTEDGDQEALPASSTQERLSHKGAQSEDDMEDEKKDWKHHSVWGTILYDNRYFLEISFLIFYLFSVFLHF